MNDYEFYWTIFHGVLGLVSLMGIVYLSAKSEKIIKIYPMPTECVVNVIEHGYRMQRYQMEHRVPREYEDKRYAVDHIRVARDRFARDLAELATMEEYDDRYQFRDEKIILLYLDLAIRTS